MKAIRDADLKVALDPMYGVSETSLKTILFNCPLRGGDNS